MTGARGGSLRAVGVAGLGWGSTLLLRGPEMFEIVQGRAPSSGERDALILLGARHLAQGLLQVFVPHHLAQLWIAVDVVHAASMLAVAAAAPVRRRAALTSAGAAALDAVASAGAAGRR